MVSIEKLKMHLRLEDTDTTEDATLQLLMATATSYITDMTTIPNDEDCGSQYEMVCYLLIAHWYQNREIVSAGSIQTIPYGFSMLLTNLRPPESMF